MEKNNNPPHNSIRMWSWCVEAETWVFISLMFPFYLAKEQRMAGDKDGGETFKTTS